MDLRRSLKCIMLIGVQFESILRYIITGDKPFSESTLVQLSREEVGLLTCLTIVIRYEGQQLKLHGQTQESSWSEFKTL